MPRNNSKARREIRRAEAEVRQAEHEQWKKENHWECRADDCECCNPPGDPFDPAAERLLRAIFQEDPLGFGDPR